MPLVFVVENLFVAQMTRKCVEIRLRMLTTSSQWRENSGVLLCSTRALSPPSGQFKNNQLHIQSRVTVVSSEMNKKRVTMIIIIQFTQFYGGSTRENPCMVSTTVLIIVHNNSFEYRNTLILCVKAATVTFREPECLFAIYFTTR